MKIKGGYFLYWKVTDEIDVQISIENNIKSSTRKRVIYITLIMLGPLILFVNSLTVGGRPVVEGAHLFSSFLVSNYTPFSGSLLFIVGFLTSYIFELKPAHVGLCLVLVFPVTAIIESIFYHDSHNLLPIEFVRHIVFSQYPVCWSFSIILATWPQSTYTVTRQELELGKH